jgi:hypothetical protein
LALRAGLPAFFERTAFFAFLLAFFMRGTAFTRTRLGTPSGRLEVALTPEAQTL